MPQEIAQKARQGMKGYIPLPAPSSARDSERSLELAGAKRDESDESTVDTFPVPGLLAGPPGAFRGLPGAGPFRGPPPSVQAHAEQDAATDTSFEEPHASSEAV